MLHLKESYIFIKNNIKYVVILLLVIGIKFVSMNYNDAGKINYLEILGENFGTYETILDFTYNSIINFVFIITAFKIFSFNIRKNIEFTFLRTSRLRYVVHCFINILVMFFYYISILTIYIFILSMFFGKTITIDLNSFIATILIKSIVSYFMIFLEVLIGELYFIPYISIYALPVVVTIIDIKKYFACIFASSYINNLFLLTLAYIIVSSILAKIVSKNILKFANKL
ncbi:MAG: hypothetical protein RR751_03670 [Clostridia bacterium]